MDAWAYLLSTRASFDASIIALLALLASAVTGILTWRSNLRRDQATAVIGNAQTAIDAYDRLCKSLEGRIAQHEVDLGKLGTKLRLMEVQHASDRAVWASERASLEIRVEPLRAENVQLKAQLDALQGARS